MSGSRVFLRGVGTQMMTASHSPRHSTSVVALSPFSPTRDVKSASGTSCTCDEPRLTPSTFARSLSIPITAKPALTNSQASGSPTYPRPMIPTRAWSDSILSFSPTPLSSSRVVLRGSFPRLCLALASLLLVVVNQSFPHSALADTGHHVPETLVHFGVVDQGPHGPLTPVYLARDRLQMLRGLFEVSEDLLGGVILS